MAHQPHFTAFAGARRVAAGELSCVLRAAKALRDEGGHAPVLIFDDRTGEQIDVSFRGTADDVLKRLAKKAGKERLPDDAAPAPADAPRGPGRPKLGVVAREVTLLPRHWDWLSAQPGGASAALRRLVDDARRASAGKDHVRRAQEAAYRFMSAVAGNEAGFEEAARALFAGKPADFDASTGCWPADVRDYARKLAAAAFQGEGPPGGAP
ncbi:hypothetical protein SOCE26_095340 [Sorangium cellulosum]|uniref:DUF2239 domain-containing protein n=1 Tax=Sorangium cellulosum TaxID=56 RepID=A0A2L0F8S8_SORCE|nr:DUF2239 family protein [Sorangium cellulosum]AUX48008.1 hypothetical protein SOCE26_095340 [Sorangium cellulosum]